jgi:hypothetical protein
MTINTSRIMTSIFILNIFRVYPSFFPGSLGIFFGGRVIDILVVTTLAILMILKSSKVLFSDICLLLGIPVFIISLLYGISLFSGISMGYEFSTFSLVEFFRYSLLGIVGLAFLTFGKAISNSFISKFWIYAVILNLTFNLCLLFIPGFQSFADILISSKTKFAVLGSESSTYVLRSSGLFINPNWAGLFFNLALTYFIFSPKEILKISRFFRSILILFTFICIFMTGSRTTLICTATLFLLYFLLKFKLWSIPIIFFTYIVVQFISLSPENWSFLPLHYRALLNSVFIYGDLSSIASFDDRLELWAFIYDNFILLRPSIGFGVTDSIGIADNQFLWMLVSYGYLGTSMIFLYFIILLTSMFLKKNMNSNDIFYAKYVNITFILFLVAGMAGQFFNVTQLIFLWFMIFGIYLSRIRGS